eukprot:scaffold98_cov248-Ochromonas_danica.AAC.9
MIQNNKLWIVLVLLVQFNYFATTFSYERAFSYQSKPHWLRKENFLQQELRQRLTQRDRSALSLLYSTISNTGSSTATTIPSAATTGNTNTIDKDALLLSNPSVWKGLTSAKHEIKDALNEISNQLADITSTTTFQPDFAIFFISSVYESYKGQETCNLEGLIHEKFPQVDKILGCTTNSVVGVIDGKPAEIEARAGLTMVFLDSKQAGLNVNVFQLTTDGVIDYINSNQTLSSNEHKEGGLAMIFSTESEKKRLSRLAGEMSRKESWKVIGGVASTVSALQGPKVYYQASQTEGMQRLLDGLIGVTLEGNIDIHGYIASSITPIGPTYKITTREGQTLKFIEEERSDGEQSEARVPLEELDKLLAILPVEHAAALKRELIIVVWPSNEKDSKRVIYGQRPVAFDQYAGSITLPSLTGGKQLQDGDELTMQFAIRDSLKAKTALEDVLKALKSNIDHLQSCGSVPQVILSLSNLERGVKTFRYQSWETMRLQETLASSTANADIPLTGFFADSSFCSINVLAGASNDVQDVDRIAVLDTDALITVLTSNPKTSLSELISPAQLIHEELKGQLVSSLDILTPVEKLAHDDEQDRIIVSKRDPESAHALKVGSMMDFLVPDKVPQPRNILEALVWEREKEVDRQRERFATARALSMVKGAEKTLPPRNLLKVVSEMRQQSEHPVLIVELLRASLHNGEHLVDISNPQASATWLTKKVDELASLNDLPIAAVACNADGSCFKGQFEDIETLRGISSFKQPIICNDFVQFAYQIFRARTHGADAIRLWAPSLTAHEMAYLAKSAKVLNMASIVVVASVEQAIDVLTNVPQIDAISFSNRNMKLWKVRQLTAERRSKGDFLVMVEGFSDRQDLIEASQQGVDAIYMGEELVYSPESRLDVTLKKWWPF